MSRGKVRNIEICADCGAPDPTWASINRGILICDECCSVHRSLGRHRSQVKSLNKSAWSPTQLAMVQTLYSSGANSVWEHTLLDPNHGKGARKKPSAKDPLHPVKADFIRAKHQNFAFVHRPNKEDGLQTETDLSQQLYSSVRTANVETSLRLLSFGADPNYFHPEKGNYSIHVASSFGQSSQVELLFAYGADPASLDVENRTPADYARKAGHNDIADRLDDCQYEVTDRLAFYLCGRRPDHRLGHHFIIPEMADSLDLSELAKAAKRKLQALSNNLFEELTMDAYDEVDRRENDAIWLSTQNHSALVTDRQTIPFLPVNPEFSTTRNQGRQKLARFNAREFATLVIDILNESKRRYLGLPISSPLIKDRLFMEKPRVSRFSLDGKGNLSDDEPVYDSVASDDENQERHSGELKRVLSVTSHPNSKEPPSQKFVYKMLHGLPVPDQRHCCHCSVIANNNRNNLHSHFKSVASSSDPSDVPITLTEYVDVKKQLASSEMKINKLLRNNTEMKQEITLLQNTVHTLMRENSRLRSFVASPDVSHQNISNGYESMSASQQTQGPAPPSGNNSNYSSENQLSSCPGRGSTPPRVSNQRPQSMYEARERHLPLSAAHAWSSSNAFSSSQNCCPPYGFALPRDDSGIGHTHSSLSSRNSGEYDNTSGQASHNSSCLHSRSNSMSPPTEMPPIIPGRPIHPHPASVRLSGGEWLPSQDQVVRKTEQITKKIQELLISAQEGKHECFVPCSEKIYRAVIEMAGIFPQSPIEDKIHSALKQLTGCAVRLQLECRAYQSQQSPIDYRFVTQQVIQCAYDIAKAAKQIVTFFE